jgi:hypothetical protein
MSFFSFHGVNRFLRLGYDINLTCIISNTLCLILSCLVLRFWERDKLKCVLEHAPRREDVQRKNGGLTSYILNFDTEC